MRVQLTLLALFTAMAAPAQMMPRAPMPDTVPHLRVAHYPHPASSTWLSLGGTLVPAAAGFVIGNNSSATGGALVLGGLLAGPATGYWSGHIGSKALPGLLIRTGGLVLMAAGSSSCFKNSYNSLCNNGASAAVIGGALVVLGSAAYDIATVGKKVRANNGALARASVVPLFSPSERRIGAEIIIGF
jgi:hypothetical protein